MSESSQNQQSKQIDGCCGVDQEIHLKRFNSFVLPILIGFACIICQGILVTRIFHAPPLEIDAISGVVQFITKNLHATPISHLRQINATDTCPDGYITNVNRRYAGIQPGCLCPDNTTQPYETCSDPCKKVEAIPQEDFTVFLNSKICIKYMQKWKLITETQQCDAGFKKCLSYLCIGQEEDCPVTFLVQDQQLLERRELTELTNHQNKKVGETNTGFNARNQPVKKVLPIHNNYEENVLSFNNIDSILISSSKHEQLFINFVVTKGDPICYNVNLTPELNSHHHYPFNPQMTGCDDYGSANEYAQLIAKQQVIEYLKQNDPRIMQLPFINKFYDKNDQYSFYIMKRMEIKPEELCYNLDPIILTIRMQEAQKIMSTSHVYSAILVISSLINIILAIIIWYKYDPLNEKSYQEKQKQNNQKPNNRQFDESNINKDIMEYSLQAVTIFIIIGLVAFYIYLRMNLSKEFIQQFSQFIEIGCFMAPAAISAMSKCLDYLELVQNICYPPIVIMFFIAGVYIIAWILSEYFLYKRYNVPFCKQCLRFFKKEDKNPQLKEDAENKQ